MAQYVKTICDLNYRTGPGTSYKKVGVLKKGTVISMVAMADNWCKFEKDKKYYFCSGKYLSSRVTDYGAQVARQVLPMAKKVVENKSEHVGGSYTYSKSKVNCSVFVSAVLQNGSVLPTGTTLYHTSKKHRKKTIGDCVHNRNKVSHYSWHKTNKIYKKLPGKYKKPGCIYVYASSIAIVGSDGYIYGCHSSGKRYTKLSMIQHKSKSYEHTSPVLVVGVPKVE